jgi:purine-binding chemotaxis protein CheW
MNRSEKTMTADEGKYLTFKLAGEEYGISILKIKEIIGMMPITPVPQTPEYVKGVINLRGMVVPLVDLRLRLGMAPHNYTERTCIVVIELSGRNGTILMGIAVDTVLQVLNIKNEAIEESPSFGAALDTDFILGIAKMESSVKILLDLDQVLMVQEIGAIEKIV